VLHWNQVPIFKRFRDIWLQIYRGHDLDLLGSRDIIGHVTIFKRFRDIWLQIYRGHDLDLLGSRDIIGHVTI